MVVSEIITTKKISLFNNLNLDNCFLEFTPTKTSGCDTLLYITNHLLYKFRNNLNIYEKNVLESTLIEIVKSKKSNTSVRVIYRHTATDLTDFNSNCLNRLLDNTSKNTYLETLMLTS